MVNVNIKYYHTLLPGVELKICDILVVPAEKVFHEDQGFLKVVCVALYRAFKWDFKPCSIVECRLHSICNKYIC